MADPKSVIVEIKNGLSDVRQQMNLLKQDTAAWVSSLGSGVSKMSSAGGSGGGGGGSSAVASNPKFTPPASQTGGGGTTPYQPMGGNVVANNPSFNPPAGGDNGAPGGGAPGGGYTGNTSLTKYLTENAAAGFLYSAALTSGMLDQPGETVEAQLLMKRTAYFNDKSYNNIRDLQSSLGQKGTIKDKLDVSRGLASAQSIGVTGPNVTQGSKGMGSVAEGVAATSNLLPGAGFEGTMRAFSSMQQAKNVNMLRGIGIQLRDENGNLTPPDKIIDSLWKKIVHDYQQAYGSGSMPKERELLIGMQPGNSIDSMLDMYFGNDPMAKQLIANGLLYKAKTGGGAISKTELTRMGATTEAVGAFSRRNAAAGTQLGLTANAGAEGYKTAANFIAGISEDISSNESLLSKLQYVTEQNAKAVTALGAISGSVGKVLASLIGLGGKAGAAITALVGIAGLGVAAATSSENDTSGGSDTMPNGLLPKTDGEIASKNATDDSINNSSTKVGQKSFALALLRKLDITPTQTALNALMAWQKEEGGHWLNSAAYNPLNTTYSGGAVATLNGKPDGVKAYGDWESGVNATAATLTGANAKARGYEKIVSALKSGDQTDIYAAILASQWVGKNGLNDEGKRVGSNNAYEGFGNYTSTTDEGKTYNLGGVTFNIIGTGKSSAELYKEFKDLMDAEERKAQAANG
jgi:hypothetical protein